MISQSDRRLRRQLGITPLVEIDAYCTECLRKLCAVVTPPLDRAGRP